MKTTKTKATRKNVRVATPSKAHLDITRQESIQILLQGLKIQLQFGITHQEKLALITKIDTLLA